MMIVVPIAATITDTRIFKAALCDTGVAVSIGSTKHDKLRSKFHAWNK